VQYTIKLFVTTQSVCVRIEILDGNYPSKWFGCGVPVAMTPKVTWLNSLLLLIYDTASL